MFKQGKEYTAWSSRYHCVWADEKGAVMEVVGHDEYNRFWQNHDLAVHYKEAPERLSLWFNVFESASDGSPWISTTSHKSQQAALNYAKNACVNLKLLDTIELAWEPKQ